MRVRTHADLQWGGARAGAWWRRAERSRSAKTKCARGDVGKKVGRGFSRAARPSARALGVQQSVCCQNQAVARTAAAEGVGRANGRMILISKEIPKSDTFFPFPFFHHGERIRDLEGRRLPSCSTAELSHTVDRKSGARARERGHISTLGHRATKRSSRHSRRDRLHHHARCHESAGGRLHGGRSMTATRLARDSRACW
jgi:hypothetical protein